MAQLNDLVVTGAARFTNPINGYIGAGRVSGSAVGEHSTAEGYKTYAIGTESHAEGYKTCTYGNNSHAEGYMTSAAYSSAHVEGCYTYAKGNNSHAEGYLTTASNEEAHAEGKGTCAYGQYSHAEGSSTKAGNYTAHAEGGSTTAIGQYSHAEGCITCASGDYAHTEGFYTYAKGNDSHAEGYRTTASNDYSHAGGYYTKTGASYQTVIGRYNRGRSNTLFEIGNGSSGSGNERNVFEVGSGGITTLGDDGIEGRLRIVAGNSGNTYGNALRSLSGVPANYDNYLPAVSGQLACCFSRNVSLQSSKVIITKIGTVAIATFCGMPTGSFGSTASGALLLADAYSMYRPVVNICFLGLIYNSENANYVCTCDLTTAGQLIIRYKGAVNTRATGIATTYALWAQVCWETGSVDKYSAW